MAVGLEAAASHRVRMVRYVTVPEFGGASQESPTWRIPDGGSPKFSTFTRAERFRDGVGVADVPIGGTPEARAAAGSLLLLSA